MRIRKVSPPLVQMRVLLLGLTGAEPAFGAWRNWLTSAGVPFEAVALNDLARPIELVDEDGGVRFQGLILADAGAVDVALEPSQRGVLERTEGHLGLRRLTAYAVPAPEHGLCPAHWSGPMDDLDPSLTAAGREVFPYLRDRVPVDPGSWVHLAFPSSPRRFETLVAGPEQSAIVGVYRHDDGREEMVQTFDANSHQSQGQALRRGQLAWLTRGSHVGLDRHYLSVQIDDVLMANHSWNVATHECDRRPEQRIRMRPRDADEAARWIRARGIRLDLACNGAGSSGYPERDGANSDPLLAALLAHRDAFGWLNHTYRHLDLDEATQSEIEAEIERNVAWAAAAGVTFDPASLITGAHTGLANLTETPPRVENPSLGPALSAQRISWIACDASRPYPAGDRGDPLAPGVPFRVGGAFAVPRHPTLLPHDAATPAQVLDRLRSAGTGAFNTFDEVIDREARRLFNAVISNDPRPHYFHQSNLIGAGVEGRGESASGMIYVLLDAVLARYRAYVRADVTFLQPTLGEIGRLLKRQQSWQRALALASVTAYLDRGRVTIVNRSDSAVDVPVTGTVVGDEQAGIRSGWIPAPPGETTLTRPAVTPSLRRSHLAAR